MADKHRLDRYLSLKIGIPKKDVRLLLAQKRVKVNGVFAESIHDPVDQFSLISLDDKTLPCLTPIYIMMHKPKGVISATKDPEHQTVIDLLFYENSSNINLSKTDIESLHIAGRLDLNSSGLLLLTNDSSWSKKLSSPNEGVSKIYEVELEHPISNECIEAFAEGMYFPFEDITTKPAKLEKLSDIKARVILTEGKYHQIKRMFGRFRNPVLRLHRTRIGKIALDTALKPGETRYLHDHEIKIN